MRRWFQASFLLAAAVFGGSELIARLFFAESLSGRFEYGFHPTAGFHERADGVVELQRVAGRRFLAQTFSRERPPGVFRLMVVGNSVPYGPGRVEDSFAGIAAEQLRAQGVKAEGLNLAIVGHGPLRNQVVVRQALNYQPSLLALQVDATLLLNDEVDWQRRAEFLGWHPKVWLMKSLIIRRLYELKTEKLYLELLPGEIRAQNTAGDLIARLGVQTRGEPAPVQAARQERFREIMRETVSLARARGIPVLLFTQAFLDRDAPGPERLSDRGLDAFSQSLTGNGVYALSLKETFAALPPLTVNTMFVDQNHLHRSGQEAIATAMTRMILTNGWSTR